MGKIMTTAVLAAAVAGTAFALPGDLVVLSARLVPGDEAAGLYYLGSCAAGQLYNGDGAALARVAPYRALDKNATAKDYYVVWAPADVTLDAAAFRHMGCAVKLGPSELLVGVRTGFGAGDVRAVERRLELRALAPVTRAEWGYRGEPPPTAKDPAVEAAINTITEAAYAGYIQTLQNFQTRHADSPGNAAAAAYIRDFFSAQGLNAALWEFPGVQLISAYYPEVDGIYFQAVFSNLKRSTNGGASWSSVYSPVTNGITASFWLTTQTGFVGGYNGVLAKTTDAGASWTGYTFAPGCYCNYLALFFLDADHGWMGGEMNPPGGGFMKYTDDGGVTWSPQTVPQDFRATSLSFYDGSHGWAAGYVKAIYYTADGGAVWQPCQQPTDVGAVVDLAAAGPVTAYAVDGTHRLLRTTDGLNWAYFNPGISGSWANVEFPDATYGWVAGDKLIGTDDGGSSWREVTNAPAMTFNAMAFADASHGVFADAAGGNVYKTDDGGVTFTSIKNDLDLNLANVVAEKKGAEHPEEIVLVGGHMDSISDLSPGTCPGADDNASGTAVAMAAALVLKNLPTGRTVQFVAFDAEESGTLGSQAYANWCAKQGLKIVAVINADMVAYDEENGARDDYVVDDRAGAYSWLFDYLKAVGALYGQGILYEDGTLGCDTTPFWNAGYAAIGVIEGSVGVGGSEVNPYIHTTRDTIDTLDTALAVRCVRDLAATVAHLARSEYAGVNDPCPPPTRRRPYAFSYYPNPYHLTSGRGGVTFKGIAAPAELVIYDLAGRKVAVAKIPAGQTEYVWQPAAWGATLAPGIYLFRVEGQGQREVGKLAVVR